jgi:hypothetical protein
MATITLLTRTQVCNEFSMTQHRFDQLLASGLVNEYCTEPWDSGNRFAHFRVKLTSQRLFSRPEIQAALDRILLPDGTWPAWRGADKRRGVFPVPGQS